MIAGGAVLASVASLAQRSALAPTQEGRQLLHSMFQDHAVLQRDRPISLYGDATPGAAVTVSLGTVSAEARAGSDGHWRATLPATTAGGPYTLTATANGETSRASDVLVGDVFLCAGQSNMAFAQRQADGAAEDARTATDAQIRHLTVPPDASVTPRQDFARSVHWVVASPETVGSFSAACYYFARELKKTANVPIGLVNASYGGARLRTFMSEAALRKLGTENDALDLLDLYRTDPAAAMRRWGAQWESAWEDGKAPRRPPVAAGVRRGVVEDRAAGARRVGVVERHQPGRLHRSDVDAHDRHAHGRPGGEYRCVARSRFRQPGRRDLAERHVSRRLVVRQSHAISESQSGVLKPGVNVIATNVYCGWRDCGIRGPAETRAIRFARRHERADRRDPWKVQEVADGLDRTATAVGIGARHHARSQRHDPAGRRLHLPRRGLVSGRVGRELANTYKTALLAMMGEWRRQFDDPELPFLIVQLPGYGAGADAAHRRTVGRLCARRSGKRRLPTRTPPSR